MVQLIQSSSRPIRVLPPTEKPEISEGLVWLTKLLDDAITVPGTNISFGLDAVIGLVPVLGDTLTAFFGFLVIQEAKRLGVPGWVRARMIANLALDGVVGAIPFVGDLFDMAFKAHRKNLRLLQAHLEKQKV
jgi:hypothetical protein